MSKLSLVFAAFFITLLISLAVEASSNVGKTGVVYRPAGGEGSVQLEDCPKECGRRCSATSHKSRCLYFCDYCCQRCLCVPSGTYGNREECPCYNNIRTKEGANKCP